MKWLASILALALCLGQGCATSAAVAERLHGGTDMLYPATRYDAFFWAMCSLPGSGLRHVRGVTSYKDPLTWVVIPVVTVGCVADLVPSLVTDTVLLPVDIVQQW